MTPEQIEASTDVSTLFQALRTAKDADDPVLVRQIEARMRDLAGHNTRYDASVGKRVASDPGAMAHVRNDGEFGGGSM